MTGTLFHIKTTVSPTPREYNDAILGNVEYSFIHPSIYPSIHSFVLRASRDDHKRKPAQYDRERIRGPRNSYGHQSSHRGLILVFAFVPVLVLALPSTLVLAPVFVPALVGLLIPQSPDCKQLAQRTDRRSDGSNDIRSPPMGFIFLGQNWSHVRFFSFLFLRFVHDPARKRIRHGFCRCCCHHGCFCGGDC